MQSPREVGPKIVKVWDGHGVNQYEAVALRSLSGLAARPDGSCLSVIEISGLRFADRITCSMVKAVAREAQDTRLTQ